MLDFEISQPAGDVIAGVALVVVDSLWVITQWSRPKDLPSGCYRVAPECRAQQKPAMHICSKSRKESGAFLLGSARWSPIYE